MAKLRFTIFIQRSPETVYKVLADLRGYKSWLPSSNLFRETTVTTDGPVQVGTAYVDKGPSSEMQGEVTALKPHSHIVFHQAARKGMLDIYVRYTLQPKEGGTQVVRELKLRTKGLVALLQPVLVRAIRKENERILQRLKWYLEAR
ncbi:hypothetical protein KSC_015150 [Ktedonobacter sp. SOSP1-52]|uniref:SRPBCC family protein n=1 Tax=Ktedonobacter sp. SOSP1-52 TaxID=2778366 RepID=UPI001914E6E4|nr:SRPBCC family protein [Ktedonobacter sp. SOSP1-52]GHO62623.1 hypothetical protein KSC_015150 [Ktedonobacter sp. SOSP1-52]